ncbi:MAG TPA: bacillithiol biosynthesis deacetylase BshB1 [Longimicrobiales bacterium]|nr:bacillithiol biosynthesis deacetylase BshB1 [Longimicrobiales bacterium]
MVDVLAIMAHPDDAELLCAGALLHAADRGRRTAVLDLSGGERGSWGDAGQRAEEAAAAALVLGLAERRTAGLPDGALENSPAARAVVAAHVRALRPRIVILHWPDARHPDHRAASELGRDACFLAGVRNSNVAGEPYRPHKLLHALTYAERAPEPTFVVDISDQMERKIEAIFAFGSQFDGKTAMGDVFSGERPLREQIRAYHAYYGSLIRRPYGEPYRTKETMRVGDVTELDVSSF